MTTSPRLYFCIWTGFPSGGDVYYLRMIRLVVGELLFLLSIEANSFDCVGSARSFLFVCALRHVVAWSFVRALRRTWECSLVFSKLLKGHVLCDSIALLFDASFKTGRFIFSFWMQFFCGWIFLDVLNSLLFNEITAVSLKQSNGYFSLVRRKKNSADFFCIFLMTECLASIVSAWRSTWSK